MEKKSAKSQKKLSKAQVEEIFDILVAKFGQAKCELDFNNNFQLLVAVILSARCTDKRVNQITKSLFVKYRDAKDLANASVEELEKDIYSCGFYKNKAKNLIAMAKDLVERFNGEVPDDYDDLISLAGVGRKTANVVMFVGYKKPAIAVDTHVFRVSNRLGVVAAKTPLECELALQKAIDKSKWGDFHHLLVLFGRYACPSRSPKCENCELKTYCNYYKKNNRI